MPCVPLPKAAGWDAGAGWVQGVPLWCGTAARAKSRCGNDSAGALDVARLAPPPRRSAPVMPLAPFREISAP